ncbi:MAG: porin family protein [Bacteroidota bacterium]
MKKLFVLAAVICFAHLATAQDAADNTPKFHFGVKVGAGTTWLRSEKNSADNTPESDGSLLRASYGFIGDIRFSKNYYFSTGVDVSYGGGKLKKSVGDTITWEETLRLSYVEFPLTLRLQTNPIGYLKYYFQAGISPGINLKSQYDLKGSATPGPNPAEQEAVDASDDINGINLSMIIGGGITYNLTGTTDMIVGLTFRNGLLDISDKNSTNPVLSNSKLIANMLNLNVGILF